MLKNLFNRIYDDNIDVNEIIKAVQPELDTLMHELRSIFDNTFPIKANVSGLVKWETILGITADPAIETIEFRRGRIINRLSSNIPYTERALQEIMDNIMGADAWSYILDYRNYRLDITSLKPGRLWLKEMEITLDKIIPANIIYYLHVYYQTWRAVSEDYQTWREAKDTYVTWRDVLEDNRR